MDKHSANMLKVSIDTQTEKDEAAKQNAPHYALRSPPPKHWLLLPVQDYSCCERPEAEVDHQGFIGQQDLRRISSLVFMVDQVQVAKDAVKDKGQSQKKPLGVKLAHGFLAHRIQRIAHHGGGSDNTNHHIEKMGVILPQNLSVRFRFLAQKDKLVATLTKTQKKRKQRGAKQQP